MAMVALAAAWFRREDWDRWQTIDPEMEPDYDYWLRRMKERVQQLRDAGQTVQEITVDPDAFLEWSAAFAGGAVNSQARASYAAMMLAGKVEGPKRN